MEVRHHIAVFSDVHADMQALRSIIDDANSRGIARIWNLGDFATGGPDPTGCVDLCLETCEVNLFGNHEFFITTQAWRRTSRPGPAIVAAEFAYLQLGGAAQNTLEHLRQARRGVAPLPRNRIADLCRLPTHAISQCPSVELVHGNLLNPMDGFMRAAAIPQSMARAQAPIVLCGHTHLPGCYVQDGEQVRSIDAYRATGEPIALEAPLAILNPGAGCDRDGARWLELIVNDQALVTACWHQTVVRSHGQKWRVPDATAKAAAACRTEYDAHIIGPGGGVLRL